MPSAFVLAAVLLGAPASFAQTKAFLRVPSVLAPAVPEPAPSPTAAGLASLPCPFVPRAAPAPGVARGAARAISAARPLSSLSGLGGVLRSRESPSQDARLLEGFYSGAALRLAADEPAAAAPPAVPELRVARTYYAPERMTDVAVTPDGKHVIGTSVYRKFWIWDRSTGGVLRAFPNDADASEKLPSWTHARRLTVTHDGRHLLAGEDSVSLWDIEAGREKVAYKTLSVSSLALSPDDRFLFLGGRGWIVKLELETGRELERYWARTFVGGLDPSPDGSLIYWASGANGIRGAVTRRSLETGHESEVPGVAGIWVISFARDGNRLIVAGDEKSAAILDAASGRVLARLEGQTRPLWDAAFTPDGEHVLSVDFEGKLKLWSAYTGRLEAQTDLMSDPHRLAVTPDGAGVLVSDKNNSIREFALPPRAASLAEVKDKLKPLFFDVEGVNGIGINETANEALVFFATREARAAAREAGLLQPTLDGFPISYRLDTSGAAWPGSRHLHATRHEDNEIVPVPSRALEARVRRLSGRVRRSLAAATAMAAAVLMGLGLPPVLFVPLYAAACVAAARMLVTDRVAAQARRELVGGEPLPAVPPDDGLSKAQAAQLRRVRLKYRSLAGLGLLLACVGTSLCDGGVHWLVGLLIFLSGIASIIRGGMLTDVESDILALANSAAKEIDDEDERSPTTPLPLPLPPGEGDS